MKTYEEMARDVLKRRDEELQKLETLQYTSENSQPEVFYPTATKKRRLLPAVAIPCAAALAVGAVTVGLRYGSGLRGNSATESEVSAALTDDRTGETEQSGAMPNAEPTTRINILDSAPEHLRTLFESLNLKRQNLNLEESPILFTDEEINNWYGVELDRLSKLHKDWELNEGFGGKNGYVYVYSGDETESENIGDYMLDGRKVIYESGIFNYVINDGSNRDNDHYNYDLSVTAGHIGVIYSFDPFDSSVCPERNIISYINGREALIYHAVDGGGDHLQAMIKYGQTIVTISGINLSEDEFITILDEFTLTDNKTTDTAPEKLITILDDVPEYLLGHSIFSSFDFGDAPPHMEVMLTGEELNSYFGVELDRLSKLHPDWNGVRDDGDVVYVYSGEKTEPENSGDWMIDGRKVIYERSLIGYDFKGDETAELLIQVEHVGFFENSFSPFDSSVYSGRFSPDNFSYINGRAALIFHYMNEDIAPYCDHAFEAIIDYGDSFVFIGGFDLSEDEFLNILNEFTAPDERA